MCDYALHLSNGNDEIVPIMVRKQLLSTWVNTKCLLQQQIGQNLNIDDELHVSVYETPHTLVHYRFMINITTLNKCNVLFGINNSKRHEGSYA